MDLRVGDEVTIEGAVRLVPSGRRWWQFWKPRMVPDSDGALVRFIVTEMVATKIMMPDWYTP
mgnify:CR=1 FL=1